MGEYFEITVVLLFVIDIYQRYNRDKRHEKKADDANIMMLRNEKVMNHFEKTLNSLGENINKLTIIFTKFEVKLEVLEDWRKEMNDIASDLYTHINGMERNCAAHHSNKANTQGNNNITFQQVKANEIEISK